MATVYKVELKTVSPWCAFTPEQVEKIITKLLDNYRNEQGMGFENTEVKVKQQ